MANRLVARLWRPGQLLRSGQPLRFTKSAARDIRNFHGHVRLPVKRLQLDVRSAAIALRACCSTGSGVRRIGRLSTILWSVASFAAAISTGIGAFFASRLLLGIGEAPTFPANAKASDIGSQNKSEVWQLQFLMPRPSSHRRLEFH